MQQEHLEDKGGTTGNISGHSSAPAYMQQEHSEDKGGTTGNISGNSTAPAYNKNI